MVFTRRTSSFDGRFFPPTSSSSDEEELVDCFDSLLSCLDGASPSLEDGVTSRFIGLFFLFPSSSSEDEDVADSFGSFSFCFNDVWPSLEDAEVLELFLKALSSRDFFFRFGFSSFWPSESDEEDEDELDERFCFSSFGNSTSILCLISRSSVSVLFRGEWDSFSSTDAEQTVIFSSTFTSFIEPGFQLFFALSSLLS